MADTNVGEGRRVAVEGGGRVDEKTARKEGFRFFGGVVTADDLRAAGRGALAP